MRQGTLESAKRTANADGASAISEEEFNQFKVWIYKAAGISLSEHKQALVVGRLAARMRFHRLTKHGEYFQLLTSGRFPDETQIVIDLLTTNETHFFREPKHFDFLNKTVLATHPRGRMLRVWCAASSSGEEPYSIAMTLAAKLGEQSWEVLASDLSSRVLERARSGHFAMSRAATIPKEHLSAYCLKGVGSQEGTFLIDPKIRNRVQFAQINLNEILPPIGEFDVIFLRNVMIYFDQPTKRKVVERVLGPLRVGGYLVVGHSESITGLNEHLKSVVVSVYQKISS